MQVMVTGAAGFIGRNLCVRLREGGRHDVLEVTRETSREALVEMASRADAVVHLAGVNRDEDPHAFMAGNADFTEKLCAGLTRSGRAVPVIFASSVQAGRDTSYGRTKQIAEQHLEAYAAQSRAPVAIYRLANVFGKWCRPNYNSVVATFCHNIARDLPIAIHDPATELRLVHVDDVIDDWLRWMAEPAKGLSRPQVEPEFRATVGDLASRIRGFRALRGTHTVGDVGVGFIRALYGTYVSYLPVEAFAYPLDRHEDPRGVFVEMLRTETSGQFSFFTAHPGVTRGGHYHHVKTEKFLVLKGRARFRFRDIATGETEALETTGEQSMVVETVPGWAHDITNVGDEEMIVMLWANEVFDRERPDTVAAELTP
jgi:UDP-2-acetamido-2,6-beta-L-arabino-hexul-4-ose reductase